MADSKIDPFDVGALERAVNDSATRVSGLWLSFVAFSAYLAAAASMISHRQIFLEDPIKLPTINIDLPLVASAILLPLLFVIYHVFVLLQVVLLARTADAYNRALDHAMDENDGRTLVRQRLANTLFAQLFAGSPREREGALGWLLRGMAWITLAIAPVLVLILFEVKFLPYHSVAVTWTHRGLITVDLLVVLYLWAGAIKPASDIKWQSLRPHWISALVAVVILTVCCFFITFPGEPNRIWMQAFIPADDSAEGVPECRLPSYLAAAIPAGFDRLSLPGENLVDDEKVTKIIAIANANGQEPFESERTRSFRNRDLRCGRFTGVDLRRADFANADLSGAEFGSAQLQGARFGGAHLRGAMLDGAQLQGAFFAEARNLVDALEIALNAATLWNNEKHSEVTAAEVKRLETALGAARRLDLSLGGAKLQNASLKGAQLQGVRLDAVMLQGANLAGAQLRGAFLQDAQLQGANLAQAQLQGASLDGVKLHGGILRIAQLQGATLISAELYGADLRAADFRGANLDSARLQGALIYGAKLQGANLKLARLQGAEIKSNNWQLANVAKTFSWMAAPDVCNRAQITEPQPDAALEFQPARSGGWQGTIESTPGAIKTFIDDIVAAVPENSRQKLRSELEPRLGNHEKAKSFALQWERCAERAMPEDKYQKELAAYLIGLACGSGVNEVAQGIYRNWNNNESIGTYSIDLARGLLGLDGKPCPGAAGFDAKTKKELQEIAESPPGK